MNDLGLSSLPRNASRAAVLSAIAQERRVDRGAIVTSTGLSQATVSRMVDELIKDEVVVEATPIERSRPGRNPTLLQLNGRSGVAAGIDLGGTNCRIVLADATGETLARRQARTPTTLAGPELADWLVGNVFDLVAQHADGTELRAVAVGLPGAVAGDKSRVVGSVNLPNILGREFIDSLGEATGVPTVVDNDSNLALLGELHYGSTAPAETTVLLVLGTGLSAAVALDGRVLSGQEGLLGEFGRMPLFGTGHRIRDLVSGAGLVSSAGERGLAVASSEEIFADREAHGVLLAEILDAFTHLITLIALSYEPQSVLLTGGLSDSFDDTTLARIGAEVERSVGVKTSVRRSSMGDAAGLLGALSLALSQLYTEMGIAHDDATIRNRRDDIVAAFRAHPPHGSAGAAASPSGAAAS